MKEVVSYGVGCDIILHNAVFLRLLFENSLVWATKAIDGSHAIPLTR